MSRNNTWKLPHQFPCCPVQSAFHTKFHSNRITGVSTFFLLLLFHVHERKNFNNSFLFLFVGIILYSNGFFKQLFRVKHPRKSIPVNVLINHTMILYLEIFTAKKKGSRLNIYSKQTYLLNACSSIHGKQAAELKLFNKASIYPTAIKRL